MPDNALQPPAPVPAPAPPRRSWPVRVVVRTYRITRAALALVTVALILLVVTPIPERLFDWLDVSSPLAKADLIVCLGGHNERLLWTADVFSRGYASRIAVSNAPGAAQHMARLLTRCGVPASSILTDTTSYVTADHAEGIAGLRGVDRVSQRFLIITDYEHSRRVALCFRKGGYRNFAIYCGPHPFRNREDGGTPVMWRWRVVELPRLAYECAGLLQYWIQGRI